MKIALCKSCGSPYDEDEISDGYCLLCMPDSGQEKSYASWINKLDLSEKLPDEGIIE